MRNNLQELVEMLDITKSTTIKQTLPAEAASSLTSHSVDKAFSVSRLDPLTLNWSIFAPGRDQRPEEIVTEGEAVDPTIACPFCAEHETETPPPVWIGQLPDSDQSWAVRVVPNKFPAVEPPQNWAGTICFVSDESMVAMKSSLNPANTFNP
jgi:hypothetical protein